jgi:hypothetical protein
MRTQLIAVGVVAAVVTAVTAQAAHQLVVPRNSVGSAQIRKGAILPADLNRQTVTWLNAGAPTPRGRGVTVSSGEHGDRMRVHAATIAEGDVLGQVEYLGDLTCPNLGPWLNVQATFFDASGTVVATGSDLETSPVASVRYPLRVSGKTGSVRAEAVASVSCI